MRRIAAVVATLVLAACNGQTQDATAGTTLNQPATANATSETTQQVLAETVTQAIYSNSADGVRANLSPMVAYGVQRSEVGLLSDKMHALGDYKGLTRVSTDDVRHESTFRAAFDKGNMTVIVRDGGDGKLAAYRIASR